MNYKESKLILDEVKKAKRILLNCHKGPDPDSIGSSLGLFAVLKGLGKQVEIICPSNEIPKEASFLENFGEIKYPIDFSTFDFSKFDLFITLDSSSWEMVTGVKEFKPPKGLLTVVIDHHKTNARYGKINLIGDRITSTGEILYQIFKDWGIEIGENVATPLLTGMIGDTGAFRYPGTGAKTLRAASELMDLGADKDKIVFQIYHSVDLSFLRFWKEVLQRLKVDKKYHFAWASIPYEKYTELGNLMQGKESSASNFSQIVKGTDFGIVMVEQEKGKLSLSLRSRTGFDTSKIALELGGGGHVYASGAKVEGLPYKEAVRKVLEVARRYAK